MIKYVSNDRPISNENKITSNKKDKPVQKKNKKATIKNITEKVYIIVNGKSTSLK